MHGRTDACGHACGSVEPDRRKAIGLAIAAAQPGDVVLGITTSGSSANVVTALETAEDGITCNAICPGYIDTEINHHHWVTEQGQKLINMLPRKRVGQPQDLDALLVMLASDESGFINGAIVAADDGFAL